MSKMLITATPYLAELVTESLRVCHSIMEYRHATKQIELQRDSMHRQANHAMQQEANRHALSMEKLATISRDFGVVLTENRKNSVDVMTMYAQANAQVSLLIQQFCQPGLDIESMRTIKEAIAMLREQLSELLAAHMELGRQPMNAFVQLSDSLRDGPHRYTDVS